MKNPLHKDYVKKQHKHSSKNILEPKARKSKYISNVIFSTQMSLC